MELCRENLKVKIYDYFKQFKHNLLRLNNELKKPHETKTLTKLNLNFSAQATLVSNKSQFSRNILSSYLLSCELLFADQIRQLKE